MDWNDSQRPEEKRKTETKMESQEDAFSEEISMPEDFVKEYKAAVMQDLPDIWNRIEDRLPEKEKDQPAEASVKKSENRLAHRRKTKKIYSYGLLAAACICALLLLPAALLHRSSNRFTADMSGMAANESSRFELQEENDSYEESIAAESEENAEESIAAESEENAEEIITAESEGPAEDGMDIIEDSREAADADDSQPEDTGEACQGKLIMVDPNRKIYNVHFCVRKTEVLFKGEMCYEVQFEAGKKELEAADGTSIPLEAGSLVRIYSGTRLTDEDGNRIAELYTLQDNTVYEATLYPLYASDGDTTQVSDFYLMAAVKTEE